jgi:regulator of protease activity HflC (stomatin/prohibitin superfamily)
VKDAKSFSYDFLGILQRNQPKIVRKCNEELSRIGVVCQNLSIQNVLLDHEVQARFDMQTKARVDLNTSIIELESSRQKQLIETQMRNENLLRKAEAQTEALLIKSQGESDTITTIAKARQKEAEELSLNEIAKNLEMLRLKSDVGNKLFSGNNTQFIFRGPKFADYLI